MPSGALRSLLAYPRGAISRRIERSTDLRIFDLRRVETHPHALPPQPGLDRLDTGKCSQLPADLIGAPVAHHRRDRELDLEQFAIGRLPAIYINSTNTLA